MKRTITETVAVAVVTFTVHFMVVPAVMAYYGIRGFLMRPGLVSGKRGTL